MFLKAMQRYGFFCVWPNNLQKKCLAIVGLTLFLYAEPTMKHLY
ncbi:hypothetical protein HMPREF6745_0477 [Prevotella sp. oral taxon 472 str. F0295]|nr:hypothetical protein HMPREF6745_0477 [Prevotella sp. oral taxon 472 str. F0295]